MTLQVHPVSLSDRSTVSRILVLANWDDPVAAAAYPTLSLDDRIAGSYARFPRSLFSPCSWHLKVVDEVTGETISYSRWRLPAEMWLKSRTNGKTRIKETELVKKTDMVLFEVDYQRAMNGQFPKGMNVELMMGMEKDMDVARALFPSEEPSIVLEELKTLPGHQRRGAASLMLRCGIELADTEQLKIRLEATPFGVDLYSRYDFGTVAKVTHRLTRWGGPEEYTHTLMIRDPKVMEE